MNFSEEWKSHWPISSTHVPPLLLQTSSWGPLFFNPNPKTQTSLLSCPSILSPPILPPPPSLFLQYFLETSTFQNSNILPSTAVSISNSFGPHYHLNPKDYFSRNRLEPLLWSDNKVLVFFPTGSNLDRVGFVPLEVKDSKLVLGDVTSDGSVCTSDNVKFNHRLVRLSANPVKGCLPRIGFLLGCSLYGVHWFEVKVNGDVSAFEKPGLVYLGSKVFKSCAVAHTCWNPHLVEECLVLLESGKLFLFDMSCKNAKLSGKKINVMWDKEGELNGCGWFSCEFSWHPRILVVANLRAVYLVDCRFGECKVSCLLKVDTLGFNDIVEKDNLVALSKAGSDGFLYAVASEHWLLLCDVRKPLMPVLSWAHNLKEPCYMSVFPLSQLRSHPLSEEYECASKMGFAIILGSFWNNDFGIFCYGCLFEGDKQHKKISNFSNSFYAWELPSQLSLCGRNCLCSSCVLREEVAKDELPEWIEWQMKKELVLGFFILDKGVSSLLPHPGEHGGFTLIRLMSSGKLEMQQYSASWRMERVVSTAHEQIRPYLKDSFMCSIGEDKYKFKKKFCYVKLGYLYAHLEDNLANILFSKFRDAPALASTDKSPNERFLTFMSEKLKSFGCNTTPSQLSAADIFRDVSSPTSLYEIVCRIMWLRLPMDILEVAFSHYSEVLAEPVHQEKVSLDFPVIPENGQLPPFLLRNSSHRSNKWSSKVRPSDDFVGPVVPLPVSLVLSEILNYGISFINKVGNFSPVEEFALQCKSVICLAKEISVLGSASEDDKQYTVSLVEDKEETWNGSSNSRPFFSYELHAFSDESSYLDIMKEPNGFVKEGQRFNVMITKLPQNERADNGTSKNLNKIADDLCPVELKFDGRNQSFDGEEGRDYELLKTQFSQWQDGFIPYQDLCARLKPRQQDLKS